jgi:hypothetical protein
MANTKGMGLFRVLNEHLGLTPQIERDLFPTLDQLFNYNMIEFNGDTVQFEKLALTVPKIKDKTTGLRKFPIGDIEAGAPITLELKKEFNDAIRMDTLRINILNELSSTKQLEMVGEVVARNNYAMLLATVKYGIQDAVLPVVSGRADVEKSKFLQELSDISTELLNANEVYFSSVIHCFSNIKRC